MTTTRVTHATPAGSYAHTPARSWEYSVGDRGCKDIASQLVDENDGIRVVMGGGRRGFRGKRDGGRRGDGRNLINVSYGENNIYDVCISSDMWNTFRIYRYILIDI